MVAYLRYDIKMVMELSVKHFSDTYHLFRFKERMNFTETHVYQKHVFMQNVYIHHCYYGDFFI